MKKAAFTMLELVFVIVVIGILAAAIIPRMDRDTIYEAAEQVLGHIKYTQQLAMSDNVYQDDILEWHHARWSISFVDDATCGQFYRVGSDRDLDGSGTFGSAEAARDPLTGRLIYNDSANCGSDMGWHDDVMLTEKYGIVSVTPSGGCMGTTINFDHMGRPHTDFGLMGGHYNKIMINDCNFTLTDGGGDTATITITKETGYSFITYP